jgi:predicted DNA-binding transcriptional regulator AlpA
MTKILYKSDLPGKGIRLAPRYISKLVRMGKFPRPFSIAGGRRKAFVEAEIDQYIADKIAERDAKVAS